LNGATFGRQLSAISSHWRIALLAIGVILLLGVVLPAVAVTGDPTVVTFTSPNPQFSGGFGASVAVSGSSVVVGAPGETVVYIFNTTGSLMATLTSPNPQSNGDFGGSVAVSGSRVVVGASGETVAGFFKAGRAYIFNTTGSLMATLTSPNVESSGYFGASVATTGTSVIVGAENETAGGVIGAGHAYVFGTTGSLIATLASPNAQRNGRFGASVASSGSSVIVGALGETVVGFPNAGRAYIFGTTGVLIATLTSPNSESSADFGGSVAVNSTSVFVAAYLESAAGVSGSGRVYIFSTSGALMTTLTSPTPHVVGRFGWSVAVNGSSVVVGAPLEDGVGGHAHVFSTTGTLIATLTSPEGGGEFGYSVAVSGSSVVVGAPFEIAAGFQMAGHAYQFVLPAFTTIDCTPSSVAVNQPTQCKATVTDISANPTTPGGTVTFSSGCSTSSCGSFTPANQCTLSLTSSSTGSCSINYTPSPGTEGTHIIKGTYSGDSAHEASSGTTSITVAQRTTSTKVSCSVTVLKAHRDTQCTATVTDTSLGTAITPTGTVDWKSSGKGVFSPTSCTLIGTGGTANCTVTYTASTGKPLPQTITGTYGGDTDHSPSKGTTPITTP